jgi:hypothetical protein
MTVKRDGAQNGVYGEKTIKLMHLSCSSPGVGNSGRDTQDAVPRVATGIRSALFRAHDQERLDATLREQETR